MLKSKAEVKLERNVVLRLLAEADILWFISGGDSDDYRSHLKHSADFLAKNYPKSQLSGE